MDGIIVVGDGVITDFVDDYWHVDNGRSKVFIKRSDMKIDRPYCGMMGVLTYEYTETAAFGCRVNCFRLVGDDGRPVADKGTADAGARRA